jgi:hypothetical protein
MSAEYPHSRRDLTHKNRESERKIRAFVSEGGKRERVQITIE